MTENADRLAQAEQRVYTNELDALEALISDGLPPDEMQAAAWVLIQRIRGLQDDLMNLQRAIVRARSYVGCGKCSPDETCEDSDLCDDVRLAPVDDRRPEDGHDPSKRFPEDVPR